jgi:hypothetical protein
MNYLNRDYTPGCHEYSGPEVFHYNYFIWTVAFFIGLQFTHADVGFMQQFTLDWSVMKNWPWWMWCIFVGLLLLIFSILAYLFFLYYTIGFLTIYLGLLVAVIGAFAGITFLLRKNYNLHFHHYVLGMFVMTFSCYQNAFVTVLHGIFNGIMIEGASRWGYDPIWEKVSNGLHEKSKRAMVWLAQSRMRQANYKAAEQRAKAGKLMNNSNLMVRPLIMDAEQQPMVHSQAQVMPVQGL